MPHSARDKLWSQRSSDASPVHMIKTAAWIALALTSATWLAVASRVLRYSENHVGYNVLWLIPLFAGTAALGLLHRAVLGRMDILAWIVVLGGALSVVAIAGIYHFNVLLPYDVWLKRGMPPRPF